jgi:hypothetical protein
MGGGTKASIYGVVSGNVCGETTHFGVRAILAGRMPALPLA